MKFYMMNQPDVSH